MKRGYLASFAIYRLTLFLSNLRWTWKTIQMFIDKLLCGFAREFFNTGSIE